MSHPVAQEVEEDEEIVDESQDDEAQAEAPEAAEPAKDWHADATQLYLNEIGQNALLTAARRARACLQSPSRRFSRAAKNDRAQFAARREYCQTLHQSRRASP